MNTFIRNLSMRVRRATRTRLGHKNLSHWHPVVVPVLTFLILGMFSVVIALVVHHQAQSRPATTQEIVIITHDHEQQIVPSREPTVGKLLSKLHLTLHQGDVVEPSLSTPINQAEFRINIYRAVPVEIVDGIQKTFTFSAATTPRSIVEQAGVKVYAEDVVSTIPDQNFLANTAIGEQVVINRATPVYLNLYGTEIALRTHATTVGDLIAQKHIHLAPSDQVMPSLTAPITAGAQIFIVRNGTKITSVSQSIAMPVQTIDDPSLAFGTAAIRQQGSAGQQIITYQQNLQNGKVVSQTVIQTVVTQPAVTEIVAEGTSLSGIKGDMALAGIAPGDYNYADYIISHESGWCPTKAQGESYCPAIPDNSETPNGYGLCQATPGYKMQSAGVDWATNPVTQLRWCAGYAQSRYGGWGGAYAHWVAYRNW